MPVESGVDWMAGLNLGQPATDLARRVDRDSRILALMRLGSSYDRIAEILRGGKDGSDPMPEVTVGIVAATCRAALRHRAEEHRNDSTEARELELMRLDALTAVWQPKAEQGDRSAAEMVLKIQAARAKLQGLDAATKVEVNVQGDVLHHLGMSPEALESERQATLASFGSDSRIRTIEGSAVES